MGTKILGLLLTVLLAFGGGFLHGVETTNNARDAALLQEERDDKVAYIEQVQISNKVASQLEADKQDLKTRFNDLEGKFHAARSNAPLVQPAAAVTPLASGCEAVQPAVVDVELSRRAVWVWNSALAGADVPSGACGADDTSAEACAAGAGIGLEATWDNHAINAQSCAEDRLQHQRLIDYLKLREQAR